MDTLYPVTIPSAEASSMAKPQVAREQPKSRYLDWARLITQVCGAITICGLLLSIGDKLASYRFEVAGFRGEVVKLNETQTKILQIFERHQDVGRAAIQSQIEQLEMELKNPRPAEKRRFIQERITALKKRLETSSLDSHHVADGNGLAERN